MSAIEQAFIEHIELPGKEAKNIRGRADRHVVGGTGTTGLIDTDGKVFNFQGRDSRLAGAGGACVRIADGASVSLEK